MDLELAFLQTEPTPIDERRIADLPGAAAIMALTPFGCRWPISDVPSADFRFCGRIRHRGAYCETHRPLAYAGVPK